MPRVYGKQTNQRNARNNKNRTNTNKKVKYKLFDQQRQEYKTDYKFNHIIYDDLEEVKNDLLSFHSVDYGGLKEEEFNALTLKTMLILFDWEIKEIKQ